MYRTAASSNEYPGNTVLLALTRSIASRTAPSAPLELKLLVDEAINNTCNWCCVSSPDPILSASSLELVVPAVKSNIAQNFTIRRSCQQTVALYIMAPRHTQIVSPTVYRATVIFLHNTSPRAGLLSWMQSRDVFTTARRSRGTSCARNTSAVWSLIVQCYMYYCRLATYLQSIGFALSNPISRW